MWIGAHVSIASGLVHALDYADSVGAECIQVFAKSPRQWKTAATDPEGAQEFVDARRERGFGPVFSHTAYLINLSTDNTELREKSVLALADELVRGHLLGVDGVVTHIGNDPSGDLQAAAQRVGQAVQSAFRISGDAPVRLLLENTAGAGSTFGSTFQEIGACIEFAGLPAQRLGVCLDTCHAFAQGAEMDSESGWSEYLDGLNQCCGLDRLGLIHANDCKFERGSRRDRHEWIGDGFIGSAGFSAMVCEPRLRDLPVVTEMPGEAPVKDSENIARLKRLRDACPQSHVS